MRLLLGPAALRMPTNIALSVLEQAVAAAAAATAATKTANCSSKAASLNAQQVIPSQARDSYPESRGTAAVSVPGLRLPAVVERAKAPAPAALIRAHLMTGSGPSVFAGGKELLDALRRAPPEQVR